MTINVITDTITIFRIQIYPLLFHQSSFEPVKYFIRLALVFLPTTPSAFRPFALWKDFIASVVAGPILPSTDPLKKPPFFYAACIFLVESFFDFTHFHL